MLNGFQQTSDNADPPLFMNWTDAPGTGNQPVVGDQLGQAPPLAPSSPGRASASPSQGHAQELAGAGKGQEIRIGKSYTFSTGSGTAQDTRLEVFTVTLGEETIELLPLKSWNQLDHYKWRARGRLPAEPAGLEITPEHVRLIGETVAVGDPEGCNKLEHLFQEWLLLERESAQPAKKKPQSYSPETHEAAPAGPQKSRFSVEVDKRGQVHIHCVQGKDTVASIGLTIAGFNSLFQQGFMRKPRKFSTGALHDWVELDGELCSFEKGRNDAAKLEQLLNEHYVPQAALGVGKQVAILLNAASSTGFDIQFPVTLAGRLENYRDHLNDKSLELLQDPNHCGLLHKDIIVKLIPPHLVFKQKTPDGGEQYLQAIPANLVSLANDAGEGKTVDLSKPLNFLHLSPLELTAVFNHPTINRHTQHAPAPPPSLGPAPLVNGAGRQQTLPIQSPEGHPTAAVSQPSPMLGSGPEPELAVAGSGHRAGGIQGSLAELAVAAPPTGQPPPVAHAEAPASVPEPPRAPEVPAAEPRPAEPAAPLPNLWVKELLARPSMRHDWFVSLVYSKIAEYFGNSSEGRFGPGACWYICLGEAEAIDDPAFRGVFLTEKGSVGFLGEGLMARFGNGVVFLGRQQEPLEGIEVQLLALGLDGQQQLIFVVNDDYRDKFDAPRAALAEMLNQLGQRGAVLMSASEALASRSPIEVLWTVPGDQETQSEPQAWESLRPAS